MATLTNEERKQLTATGIRLAAEFENLRKLSTEKYDVGRTSFKRHKQCLANIISLHYQAKSLLAKTEAI